MTRRLTLALTFALTLGALAACDASGPDAIPDPTPIALTPLAKDLVGQSNGFGVDLFAETAAEDDRTLMLSPLSASVALTMLLNGTDGETYDQIRALLGYDADADLDAINAGYRSLTDQLLAADPKVELALANAVFTRQGVPFKAPFLNAMRDGFDARVDALDFGAPSALSTINGWASENTNGRIPTVLSELDPDLVMVLMNALYFKGDWTDQFEARQTGPADFHLANGQTVQVPTMRDEIPARMASGERYVALELPYGRRNFSMVVFLPLGQESGTLADLAGVLRDGGWADATAHLDAQTGWPETLVHLPKFSFSTDKLLNDQLQALGMTDAFSRDADLSRMSDDPRLLVSFVKQNTFVEVNEEGTEAAAVTTIGVTPTSAGSGPPAFIVDRSFVFAIRERTTNTLLFIGQVADPRS